METLTWGESQHVSSNYFVSYSVPFPNPLVRERSCWAGRKGEVRDQGLMDIGLKRRIRGELRVKVYLDSSVGPKKLEVFFLLKLPIRHDDSVTAYFHSL